MPLFLLEWPHQPPVIEGDSGPLEVGMVFTKLSTGAASREKHLPDNGWLAALGHASAPDGMGFGQGFFLCSRGPPSPISFLPAGDVERHVPLINY